MSAAEAVRKTRLQVRCRAIDEDDLKQDASDTFCESGNFGKVKRALWRGQDVAVKYFRSAEEKKGYKEELVFLSKLQTHNNIVQLFGTGASKTGKQPFIVMEFAPYSLERVLHRPCPTYVYSANHVVHWCRQLIVALEYIHTKRILHRDVKASNLLLFGNGCHLKLCDFGTCRKLETNLLYTASIGTVRYMAPEVIQGQRYTPKCDVFSFAITLWEMLARKVPTIDTNAHLPTYAILYQMAEGKRPPLFKTMPKLFTQMLTRCWDQDPDKRLSSAQLVKKFSKVCEYFEYDLPLLIQEVDADNQTSLSAASTITGTGDLFLADEVVMVYEEREGEENGPLCNREADMIPQTVLQPQITRSQSDLSSSQVPVQTPLQHSASHNLPTPIQEHYPHGYPPHSATAVSQSSTVAFDRRTSAPQYVRATSSGSDYAFIDHEVDEISDPHNQGRGQFASLDENILRFDIQRQFDRIQRAYNQQGTSDEVNVHQRRRRHVVTAPVRHIPAKATEGSRYSIAGLSPERQPVLPIEGDSESQKLYQQYKLLSQMSHDLGSTHSRR